MTHINAQRLQELINLHGPALTLYARQWCHAAEDAVQEAFVDLVRQDPQPDNPVAWLYLAARRRATNQARSERRRARHQRLAGEQRMAWFLPANDGLDQTADLQSLLAELPDLEREIVIARIWGELAFAQIAELVQQPLSSVHRRYQQALTELGRKMNTSTHALKVTNEPRTTIS